MRIAAAAFLLELSLLDHIVIVYALLVTAIILSFRFGKRSAETHVKAKFHAPKLAAPPMVTRPDPHWKKKFEGVWLQYKEENFDEFLKFSGTSYALRKVIPVAFFMTRHTLSVTTKTVTGADGQAQEEEYFTVKRDFGAGVREWTLTMKIGSDQHSAEAVQAVIDTEESYVFQNWANDAERSISTLSTPSNPDAGVRCVQTRSLTGPDEIRMTFDGYNLKTKESCEMVSYFKRDTAQ